MPLELVSPSTRLECVPPKRARSVGVGKPRYVVSPIRLIVFESNKMMYSAMANPHARGARLEDCLASTLRNAECEDRTKSRARTAVEKKILSTLSVNRRSLLHFPRLFQTRFICLSLSLLLTLTRLYQIFGPGSIGERITYEVIIGIGSYSFRYPPVHR